MQSKLLYGIFRKNAIDVTNKTQYSEEELMGISIVGAVDKKWGIGLNNKLLISIPADMKQFAELTTGHVCIMGRNTLQSLPGCRPLVNRVNIVLSRDKDFKVAGVTVVNTVEEALKEASKYTGKEIFIIGGESMYKEFLPYADTAYITYIDYAYQADRHMPNLDEDEQWQLINESDEQTYFNVEYYYRKYKKIS